jgi:hypothetical protein
MLKAVQSKRGSTNEVIFNLLRQGVDEGLDVANWWSIYLNWIFLGLQDQTEQTLFLDFLHINMVSLNMHHVLGFVIVCFYIHDNVMSLEKIMFHGCDHIMLVSLILAKL